MTMTWFVVTATTVLILGAFSVGGYSLLWQRRRLLEEEARRKKIADDANRAVAQLSIQAKQQAAEAERLRGERDRLTAEHAALQQRLAQPPPPPPFTKELYPIATIGTDTCGKTALTRKWAEPTFSLTNINATKFDSYEKLVRRQTLEGRVIEHTFQILDWGGEYLVNALEQLVTLGEVRALIFVVDLGEFDPKHKRAVFSQARIDRQLETFAPNLLPFFFGERIASHCRTCVLFINKSDVLQTMVSGGYEAIAQEARRLYAPLISNLERICADRGVELEIMVGSAVTGETTPHLFAYLEEHLLADLYQPDPPALDDPLTAQTINGQFKPPRGPAR